MSHTPAAMRAVKAIMEDWNVGGYDANGTEETKLADIIDKAIGLPDLLEACRRARQEFSRLRAVHGYHRAHLNAPDALLLAFIDTAIAKTEGTAP